MKYSIRMLVIDIELDNPISFKKLQSITDKLPNGIDEITPSGDFIGNKTKYIRFEIDARFYTVEDLFKLLKF